jgi:predicted O-methyltransferase YrrM
MLKGAFNLDGKLPKVIPGVHLVAGLLKETLDPFLENNAGSIDFVNIDNDLYEGALYILQRVLPRMHRGSIIHFHELLKWRGGPGHVKCEAHDEVRALYKVFDSFPGLHLELIAIRGQLEEPVIFRVIKV